MERCYYGRYTVYNGHVLFSIPALSITSRLFPLRCVAVSLDTPALEWLFDRSLTSTLLPERTASNYDKLAIQAGGGGGGDSPGHVNFSIRATKMRALKTRRKR